MSIDSTLFELEFADLQICGRHITIFPDHDTTRPGIELCTVEEMFRMLGAAELAQGRDEE